MKVYERLAEAFVAEGVSSVFGLMGDGNMNWLTAMHSRGTRIYNVRHEGSGLAMADGWARLAKDRRHDVPGVATATHGPGVTQLATSLVVASRARTPMVVFVGEGPEGDSEFHQRLNQQRFAEAVECGFVKVTSPETCGQAVFTAFLQAKTESRPIMLSVPVAVQQMESPEIGYDATGTIPSPGPIPPNPGPLSTAIPTIEKSQWPVVVVGRGAIWADAGQASLRLAERSGALLATTLMAKNWLVEDEFHAGIAGLYSTRTAIRLFERADCVIALGASLNRFTVGYGYLFPSARFVHVDVRAPYVIGGGMVADHYVQGDARLVAEAITEALTPRAGFRTPEVRHALDDALSDDTEFEPQPGTIDPRDACRLLDALLPQEIGLVLGGGHQVNFGTILFTNRRDLILANQHFGAIGHGLPTAIGASVSDGYRPVLLMEGDGGLMMQLAEFETAVRYEVPVMVVVINDQALGAEYHKLDARSLPTALATHTTPNLAELAVAMGGRGRLVTETNHIAEAVTEFMSKPGPMLLDVRVPRSVLSLPFRRLYFGMDV